MDFSLPETITTERFISLIENRPAIWDRNSKVYSNKASRDQSWTEIMTELYPDFQTWSNKDKCERIKKIALKWRDMRDAYVKSEKKKARAAQLHRRPIRPYKYHSLMSFLNSIYVSSEHMIPLQDRTMSEDTVTDNSSIDPRDKIDYVNIKKDESDSDQESDASEDSNVSEVVEAPKRRRRNDQQLSAVNVKMADPVPAPACSSQSHEFFFRGVIPQLETLDDDQILEFQIGVLKLIKQIKKQ